MNHELNGKLFFKYEPLVKRIARRLALLASFNLDFEDIYQQGCLILWKLICFKVVPERLCNDYIWKSVGLTLKKQIYVNAKRDAVIWHNAIINSFDHETHMLDLACAMQILRCKTLSTLQKQIVYRIYILDETALDVANDIGLPHNKVRSQQTMAMKAIKDELQVEAEKRRRFEKDDVRVWGPVKVDRGDGGNQRLWTIRVRPGARGAEKTKCFDSWNDACKFRRQVENQGLDAFAA